MKYRSLYIYYIAILFFSFIFSSCEQKAQKDINPISDEKLDLKNYPGEHFFFQRSYPDRSFDIKAYTTALEGIKANLHSRNSNPGFDEAWTVQGPGDAGARVNSIAIHPNSPDTIYAGFSGGGIFKTTDGGTNWFPIFDDQPYLAVGDITIDPNNPETIYVGTGDPNITGYPFIGDGVYKTTDGGATWNHMGLTDQRIVANIMIDPLDSDIIYAACMGLPFERNNERGLYKSLDGGNTWSQKLFVSDQSGIIDMLINPDNPQIIYAASWDRIRNNQESIIYGPNAKIHKSVDGGDNWTVLTNGLPSDDQGRIGLAMSGSDPDVIFAMYVNTDSQLEGIYKSTDSGVSWTALPSGSGNGMSTNALGGFGWYFGQLRVDPDNDNRLWVLGVRLWRTSNSGSNWFLDNSGSPHVDNHDLICYNNDLYLGTDGGMYIKTSASNPWTDLENIPATQVYRISYNPHEPDEYYGGTQDNGTQVGNSSNINNWDKILGGDGFQTAFHPTDSDIMYAETQRGNIYMKPDAGSGFINATSGINPPDRRNWDMQYIVSSHDPNVLYTGTYRVYKSNQDGLPLWEVISGDLTDSIIYGSNFHTITTLSESPLDPDILYVGTTDGNVWGTSDGGTSWDSLHADLPDRYITSVIASPDSADHVYVGISGYRYNDFIPHIHFSADKGNTWQDISGDLPQVSVNNVFVMPGHGGQAIFVATDGGVYGTINGGTSWDRLGNNLPMVPVYDIDWNIANNQLIAGTFGRSIMTYPLDSIDFDANPDIVLNGNIQTETGVGVDSVIVALDNGTPTQTSPEGDYDLGSLQFGSNCTITPEKDINYRNGVSTFDILLIQTHILTNDTLSSPYKIIAADVNHSESVSAFDLILIRQLILFNVDTFPNNSSWRFVDGSYAFPNPYRPFDEPFPETIDCNDLNGQPADFIGLKVGDVTGNANPGEFANEAEFRNEKDTVFLVTDDILFQKGETLHIPLKVQNDNDLLGFQFTIEFDAEVLEFESIENEIIPGLTEANFGKRFIKIGFLTFSWNRSETLNLKEQDLFLSLNFKTLSRGSLSSSLSINSKLTSKEAYGESFDIRAIEFQFNSAKPTISNRSNLRAYPNPFSSQTNLGFYLSKLETYQLSLYDVNGRLLKSFYQLQGQQGENEYILYQQDFPGPGIYYAQIASTSTNQIVKLIILD